GQSAKGLSVLLEYVSANPTGPLHVGHGRWAVIGDVIARMLKAVGAKVETEFYVNNVGKQVKLLFESVKAVQAGKPVPEGGYGGDYIKDVAQGKFKNVDQLIDLFIKKQKQTLDSLDVKFDNWFYENKLHDNKLIPKAIDRLKKLNRTFEEKGALWFKSEEMGDDKNRVLIREDGQPTYFAADIAYHFEKYNRGFDKLINIWGTDHHGYVNRLKAAMTALDLPPEKLEIIIGQLVTLYRGNEPIRMSKRTGEMVTLREVIDEIGKDATRFFFAATDVNSHLDFDLELAKKKSHENPVFYVQYAHARICSILKKSQFPHPPSPSPTGRGGEEGVRADLSSLTEPSERDLIFKLMTWPDVVAEAARLRHPHRITEYGKELGAVFHSFYEKCRVLGNPARLVLVDASRITLRNVLQLLGISAPESM
ncbi:MAG: arginine--tRNA ligase, partial [Candidatus Margulisbacteria bacterium]|nr:arginine--tRNA ligase [Candidatus Margulisiibacteriota bacterium]